MNDTTMHSAPAAFEHNGALVARQRFYEIACDPRRSVVVEACAGAGKTWMLVSRMLRALVLGAAPHEILAITFTKKAAAEMRQRLQQWLQEFAHASDVALAQALRERGLAQEPTAAQIAALRGLHAALLAQGRPVQIRTFHSWFAALLRSAPLGVLHALGLPTSYELLENDEKAVALVWRRFQAGILGDAQARADYQAAVDAYGRHQAQQALEAALSKRTEFALADAQGVVDVSVQPFAQQFPALAPWAQPVDRLHSAVVQELLWASAQALGASSLKTCSEAGSKLERALTEGNVDAIYEALFTEKGQGTQRKLSEKMAGIETVREAQALLAETRDATEQHHAWLHQQRMARLTRRLLADYAALKRERGWIDMGDLEQAALVLLSDPLLSGWVQERLDARVRHLLIDEFQDTNPLQWQALSAWLSGYAGAGHAPSVFIVGDPKQSIYRFRRAEPQVFQAAKAFVVDGLGGDLLSCDHTRRNAPPIVALVNGVMQTLQDAGDYADFRAHSTESTAPGQVWKLPPVPRPARADVEEGEVLWRDSLTTPRFEEEDSHKTLECRQAAQWLAQQLRASNGALRPSDIMVLARKRERLALMQTELAALHIAAQQPEKNELAEMPAVLDVMALLDVLVSPGHDLSLAQVLKSPLFGVSDADLVQLVLHKQALEEPDRVRGQGVSWWQLLQKSSLPSVLTTAGRTLALWKSWVDSLPPHDALSAMYQHGDVLARYASATPAAQREAVLGHLNALLDAALQIDGGRYTTAYALVRSLRAGGIAAPMRSDAQAVRLLTIHGAKGLEAPLVLLLDTDAQAPRAQSMGVLVDWPGEAAHPLRFVFLASESKPPACVASAVKIELAARQREECNALYVALTRTQHTLVLSSAQPRSPNATSWWARLQAHAQDAPMADSGGTDIAADAPAAAQPEWYTLHVLPEKALPAQAPAAYSSVAYAPIAYAPAAYSRPSATPATVQLRDDSAGDSLDSRIGQAMHRLLEWLPVQPGGAQAQWSEAQRAQAQQQFALDAAQIAQACAMAQRIASGAAAWAWDAAQLRWHGNEVPITLAGRSLRIDRLVQQQSGDWWVLDYKSSHQPQDQPTLVAQLQAYRAAVARAYPSDTVRAAFLTPVGACIEV